MKNSQVGNPGLQCKHWKAETMRQCEGIVREHMSTSPSLWPGRGDTIYLYSVGYFLNNILWRLQVTLWSKSNPRRHLFIWILRVISCLWERTWTEGPLRHLFPYSEGHFLLIGTCGSLWQNKFDGNILQHPLVRQLSTMVEPPVSKQFLPLSF